MALLDQMQPEGLYEGRLADTGDTGDPDPIGVAGVGQQHRQQGAGPSPMIGPGRLDERDRPPDRGAIAGQHPRSERLVVVGSGPGHF